MKRFLAFVVAATLAISGSSVTAFAASSFTDIKNVPWAGAATFLDEAHSLGLMNGYIENGKRYCKPKNNVTYCEAVQLAYSIMKTYNKNDVTQAQIEKWTTVFQAYNIPTWAYNATAYALDEGILESNDLSKLTNGTQNATREDVGVYFGRAMGTVFSVNSSATLSYKDKGNVTSSAVPYLALLNTQSIMVGDENNNFNPKAKINRAEMAVLSVKSYKKLISDAPSVTAPSSGTTKGTVIDSTILANGDIFLSFKTTSGAGMNLFGTASSVKVTHDGDEVELADIGKGDTLSITYSGSTLKTVEITNSVEGVNVSKTFPLKSLTTKKITVTEGSSSKTYTLASNVKVYIKDSSSSLKSLTSSVEDDNEYNVTLTFNDDDEVSRIEAWLSSKNPLSGEVTKLRDESITIKSGSNTYTYPISDNVTIKYNSSTVTFATMLKNYSDANYQVTLTLDSKGSDVTKITIDFLEDEYNGTIKTANKNGFTLTGAGEDYKYYYATDCVVKIDGKTKNLSDLTGSYEDVDYTIALTVNKDNDITRIEATTKSTGKTKGVITKLSTSKITIKGSDNKSYEYTLDSPSIKIDGKTMTLSKLKSSFEDYKFEVEITLKSNKVTAIDGKNTEATKGELKTIEPKKETLRIAVLGVNYDFSYDADDVSITLDGTKKTDKQLDTALSKLDDDEIITVKLTVKGDEVTKIVATTDDDDDDDDAETVKGVLTKVDTWSLTIKPSGKSSKSYDLAGNVDITLNGSDSSEKKLADAIWDLDDGEEVSATITLNSKDDVTKIVAKIVDENDDDDDDDDEKIKSGYIISISSSGKIKIEDNDDDTATWTPSSSLTVTYDDDDDEDYYDDDLGGLEDFFNDYDDDAWIKVTSTNSKDQATKIKAYVK